MNEERRARAKTQPAANKQLNEKISSNRGGNSDCGNNKVSIPGHMYDQEIALPGT